MKRFACFTGIFFLSFTTFSQDVNKRIDSLLQTFYSTDQPGAMVAVIYQGKLVFEKGYGLADIDSKSTIDASTNFNIGSLTKQFTAYCILQLIKQNKLSLDDKLIKFFPGFNPAIANQITIRQMLTHSSGLIDHYELTDTQLVKHATGKDVLNAVIHVDSCYFIPGTRYRYSNTAYCLLALIVEKLSGLSYRDYLKKNVFGPLSMDHSTVFKMGDDIYKRSTGYEWLNNQGKDFATFRKLDADNSIFFSTEGDGGIYTSINDYLKWIFNLQSGSILEKTLVDKASSPQFMIDSIRKLAYGFGWFISNSTENKAVYHSGSNGGFRAISFTIPGMQYSVVIFSNRTGIDLESIVEKINNLFNVNNKSFTKIESLVSFNSSWPNFAPCKEIPSFSTSFKKNWNANVMASN